MKSNVLDFISSSLVAEPSSLSMNLLNDNQFKIGVASMANKTIESDCMRCFYKEYQQLGGSILPRDVVNMVIQQIALPQTIQNNGSIQLAIFKHISQQIRVMQIKRQRDVWRLTCIITQAEYGFTVSYWKYLLKKTF